MTRSAMDKTISHLSGFAVCLFLLKQVDKFDGREAANAQMKMSDRMDANRRC